MKIGITGVTGFIGSKLASRLVMLGYDVIGFVRTDKFVKNRVDGVKYVSVDLSSNTIPNDVNVDVLVNLASITPVRYSYTESSTYFNNNVTIVSHVLDYIQHHSDTLLLHASTAEVYPYATQKGYKDTYPINGKHDFVYPKTGEQPIVKYSEKDVDITNMSSPYAITKVIQEMLIHNYYIGKVPNYLVYRTTNTYHRDIRNLPDEAKGYFIEKTVLSMLCNKEKIEYYGFPSSTRQWIHYIDHVSMYEYAIEKYEEIKDLPYHVINVAKEGIESLSDIVNYVKDYTRWSGEIVWGIHPRPVDPNHLLLNTDRLKEFYSTKKFIPLNEGLRLMIEDYKPYVEENKNEVCSNIDN